MIHASLLCTRTLKAGSKGGHKGKCRGPEATRMPAEVTLLLIRGVIEKFRTCGDGDADGGRCAREEGWGGD